MFILDQKSTPCMRRKQLNSIEDEISTNNSIVPAGGGSASSTNTHDVAVPTNNNDLVAAVAPPPVQPQAQPQALQYGPVFYPPVQVTGMVSHATAKPRPVFVMDFPQMYYVKIKVPCKSVAGLKDGCYNIDKEDDVCSFSGELFGGEQDFELFKKLGIFSARELDNSPVWELRKLLNTVNNRKSHHNTVDNPMKSSETNNSPNCKKDLRLSTMKVQLAKTSSKAAAKSREHNINNTLPSMSSIISSGKRKISSIMTSPEDEDFRVSEKSNGVATLKSNPKADIDPLMKEKLKEKNMAMVKSEQCGEM
ncbi:OLC1v1016119C1 [Oldenlandia corymbosa var. corymbosa]|uniref:OLC1v1016119C1 n=1 Tax=Oldenlandia corymbosa var. corymbosa TaxID=529605 RepID=A0AAV1E4U1_OLDCO|nr:OLC1v1016119C1 [Oldenlandia corymbosa var. corymbosa]